MLFCAFSEARVEFPVEPESTLLGPLHHKPSREGRPADFRPSQFENGAVTPSLNTRLSARRTRGMGSTQSRRMPPDEKTTGSGHCLNAVALGPSERRSDWIQQP